MRKNLYQSAFAILILLLSAGCAITATQPPASPIPTTQPAPVQLSTATEAPTDTPDPTATPEPTATIAPTVTPLPEGVLFRDDFNGSLQPGWEWQNENPDRWTITDDGWLQIIGEGGSLLGVDRQSNLLWYPLPAGDFLISVHIVTKPFENFHQTAIFIYEDAENYITINRGYCDICSTKGNGFYMDYSIGGKWAGYQQATTADDVYLRLESQNDMISGYYATEEGQWERLGRFGNYFQFQKVGIGVSNVGAASDVVGLYDYFEIAMP